MLPLLPNGHPRWDHCHFAWGGSTANYRGYGASWAVRDGHLFLNSFGGYAAEDDQPPWIGPPRCPGTEDNLREIGLIDVHEVNEPVPARWITADLHCPSGRAHGTDWHDFIPETFLLFRVVRGVVTARMSVPNTQRLYDESFDGTPLLDGLAPGRDVFPARAVLAPVDGLERALLGSDGDVPRPRLAGMLWRAGPSDREVLIRALAATDDPDRLRWIASALHRIGPDAVIAIPNLMRVLSATEDVEVAKAIAYALAGIGPAAASVLPTVISRVEACRDRKAERQIQLFVSSLGPAGAAATDTLIASLLASRDLRVQVQIAHRLGTIGFPALAPLEAALTAAEDDRSRPALARALGKIGPAARPALDLVLAALGQVRDDEARAVIAEAVAAIGLHSSAALPRLRVAFRASGNRRAQGAIAEAAASLGSEAVGFLIEEFEAAGMEGRTEITRVLGLLGTAAAPAVGCLVAAATRSSTTSETAPDGISPTRRAIAYGKSILWPPRARPFRRGGAAPGVDDCALDPAGGESTPLDRDPALTREIAEALAQIGVPAGILFTVRLAAVSDDPSEFWAKDILAEMQAAIDAGLRLPDRDIQDLVAVLVAAGESAVGRAVARMFRSEERAAEPLRSALNRARGASTRLVLLQALGQVGEAAGSALDEAVAALHSARDDPERLQIVDALRRMGQPDERHMAVLAAVLVRSSFLPVWWRLGLVLAGFGAASVPTLVRLLNRAKADGQRRALANALLEVAASDASARAALLSANRTAWRPSTRRALRDALSKAI